MIESRREQVTCELKMKLGLIANMLAMCDYYGGMIINCTSEDGRPMTFILWSLGPYMGAEIFLTHDGKLAQFYNDGELTILRAEDIVCPEAVNLLASDMALRLKQQIPL
jgi:hypothetical protein